MCHQARLARYRRWYSAVRQLPTRWYAGHYAQAGKGAVVLVLGATPVEWIDCVAYLSCTCPATVLGTHAVTVPGYRYVGYHHRIYC